MNIPAKKEVGNNDGVANGGKDVKGMRILKDKDGGGNGGGNPKPGGSLLCAKGWRH